MASHCGFSGRQVRADQSPRNHTHTWWIRIDFQPFPPENLSSCSGPSASSTTTISNIPAFAARSHFVVTDFVVAAPLHGAKQTPDWN